MVSVSRGKQEDLLPFSRPSPTAIRHRSSHSDTCVLQDQAFPAGVFGLEGFLEITRRQQMKNPLNDRTAGTKSQKRPKGLDKPAEPSKMQLREIALVRIKLQSAPSTATMRGLECVGLQKWPQSQLFVVTTPSFVPD
jgi:hypothetical protein